MSYAYQFIDALHSTAINHLIDNHKFYEPRIKAFVTKFICASEYLTNNKVNIRGSSFGANLAYYQSNYTYLKDRPTHPLEKIVTGLPHKYGHTFLIDKLIGWYNAHLAICYGFRNDINPLKYVAPSSVTILPANRLLLDISIKLTGNYLKNPHAIHHSLNGEWNKWVDSQINNIKEKRKCLNQNT